MTNLRAQIVTGLKRAIIAMLRAYKRLISPLLPPACRYVPTCSEYCMEAVARNGVVLGSLQAAWRVLRCNPLAKGGYDPVPGRCETENRELRTENSS